MSWVLFWILFGLVAWPLITVIKERKRMFEYPAIIAFAFGAFIVPQAISLIRFPGQLEESSVDAVLFMGCLCMACAILGYRLSPNAQLRRFFSRPADMNKLFHVGLFFTCCGLYFGWQLSHMEIQFSDFGGMTGKGTIILFFQLLAYPGFAICLFCATRKPTFIKILASLVGSIPLLQAVVAGRREGAALVALILLVALYYEKKFLLPSYAFPLGILMSALIIPATGTYRMFAGTGALQAVRQIDFVDNFKRFLNEESILELRNGAALLESTQKSGDYEYGAGYWNHLVFRYVPAQILGERFKESLKIGSEKTVSSGSVGIEYEFATGSTITGMGDSFQQFGWFGCLFFVFMAVIFKSLWVATSRPEAMFARLLYVLTLTSAMRAVTHWTLDFLPGFLYYVIFLGLAMLYAGAPQASATRRRGPRKKRRPIPAGEPTSNQPTGT